ncbi:hypothetical protein PR048_003063 [Dryococelus australis]|uniref:Uncharacterized protein n=1 Tax=Dryococelus australis TaxID=614101 RepID=A0ABQ9IP82_9NEOP|nr:hypothetical protein PR048_003063 [Dryococelus australis]
MKLQHVEDITEVTVTVENVNTKTTGEGSDPVKTTDVTDTVAFTPTLAVEVTLPVIDFNERLARLHELISQTVAIQIEALKAVKHVIITQTEVLQALKQDLTPEITIAQEETKREIGELRRGQEELCNRVNQRVGRLEEEVGKVEEVVTTMQRKIEIANKSIARKTADIRDVELQVQQLKERPVDETNLCQVAELVDTYIESFNQPVGKNFNQLKKIQHERIRKVTAHVNEERFERTQSRHAVLPANVSNTAAGQINMTTTMHHPSKLWTEQIPKFEAKVGENTVNYLLKLEEYVGGHQEYGHSYTLKDVPGRGKTLEVHLSEVCDKSRHLTPPISDDEFIATVLHQLPYRFQMHWSGRVDPDLASFREGILEFDRIERLKFSREYERTEAADKPPPLLYERRYSPSYQDPSKVIFSEGDKLTEGGSTIQDGETCTEGETRKMTRGTATLATNAGGTTNSKMKGNREEVNKPPLPLRNVRRALQTTGHVAKHRNVRSIQYSQSHASNNNVRNENGNRATASNRSYFENQQPLDLRAPMFFTKLPENNWWNTERRSPNYQDTHPNIDEHCVYSVRPYESTYSTTRQGRKKHVCRRG